jgi:hypothetical protein
MSIEMNWCYACKNHTKEIPEKYKVTEELLRKEYKHIIYCAEFDCLVVANDEMWIDKSLECGGFNK